jgi:hypothetical protein
MKKYLILLVFLGTFELVLAQVTYVMHYLPTLSMAQVASYKGYDMIIPDHEVINNSPESLRKMLRDNPDLQILAYVNKIEWHDPMYRDKPWSLKMVAELEKYPKWFMRDLAGQKLEFWPGTVLMNCRLDCPRYIIKGKSYSYVEYFTERYIEDIIGAYKREGIKLDGILDDELLKFISFIGNFGKNRNGIDSDGDGIQDDLSELDRNWRLGNAYFLKTVRETMGPDFVIAGNGGHGFYMEYCSIKQMEYFSEIHLNEADKLTEAWPENMRNAAGMAYALFNARTDNYGYKDNWFFTLCSSMLLDNVLFSHGQNMPYDKKYELHLGDPIGSSYQENGIYVRLFQKGKVYVDPVAKTARVER